MKTTVKIQSDIFVTVEPSVLGNVKLRINFADQQMTAPLTPDQCGALIFGMEQALETMLMREAAGA